MTTTIKKTILELPWTSPVLPNYTHQDSPCDVNRNCPPSPSNLYYGPMERTIAIVSGYFNPLHVGHLRMMREARQLRDLLIVIVNNDHQQVLKKGRVIIPEADRCEVVSSIRHVDRVILSVDLDASVRRTLSEIRKEHPDDTLIFANGGDRRDAGTITEAQLCETLGIEIHFGVGGYDKADASSRIIEAAGLWEPSTVPPPGR